MRCVRGWIFGTASGVDWELTFKPMQRIVPTSSCDRGDSSLAIFSVLSDSEPGFKADLPLKTLTSTSSPLRIASPTSRLASTGSPMRMALESLAGTKRTRRSKDIVGGYVLVWSVPGMREKFKGRGTTIRYRVYGRCRECWSSRNSSSPARQIRTLGKHLPHLRGVQVGKVL